MSRRSPWNFYNFFRVVNYSSVALSALIAANLKLDATKLPIMISGRVIWLQASAWWIIPALTGLAALSKGMRVAIGPPWVWSVVERCLNEYREAVFAKSDGDAVHYYRVTLFKRVKWRACLWPYWSTFWELGWARWPWSGWMIPVARSGHTTQNTATYFLAPDDASRAEGIVGQAWATGSTVTVDNLPNLNGDHSPADVATYAKSTFVPEEWVRKRLAKKKEMSRTICGIPVEVAGEIWGVIVLDSMAPACLKSKGHHWEPYRKLIPMFLSQLLNGRS